VQVRCPLELAGFRLPPLLAGTTAAGRVLIGRRDSRYFVLVAWILDAIAASGGRVPDAARAFGLTSSQVVAMLKREPKRLAAANAIRRKAGLAPLR
jgi:hypothetical protein